MNLPVVVIGAGIIGASNALHLRRKGFRTILVDRQPPGFGCSFGNAGAISPGSVVPIALPGMIGSVPRWLMDPLGPLRVRWRYLPKAAPWLARWVLSSRQERVERSSMALATLVGPVFDEYRELLGAGSFHELIRRNGHIYVWENSDRSRAEEVGHVLREKAGVAVEWLNQGELRELEPALTSVVSRGLFVSGNGQTIQPLKLVERLVEFLVKEGGEIIRDTVVDIRPSEDGVDVILQNGSQIAASHAVLSAGIWSSPLARRLGVCLPLEAERGYHLELPCVSSNVSRPIVHAERGFIVTPMRDVLRIAGTVEIAGVDAKPDYSRAIVLLDHARRMVAGLPECVNGEENVWMGHRPSFPDSLPVIGRCPSVPSVVFAFGHGHLGVSGAPMTGRLVSQIVAGEAPAIDLFPFRPDRFE